MKLTNYFVGSEVGKKGILQLLILNVIYAVIAWVAQFLGNLLSIIPLVGSLASIIVWIIRLYMAGCIIVAILAFFKIVK